jgi:hypothetical protein
MVRWDQSRECQAVIDRDNRAVEAWKAHCAEFKESDIRVNEIWHAANLDLLEQCAQYMRHKQYITFELLWNCFCLEESRRLGERAIIMQLHSIERLPHQHKAREKVLFSQLIAALGGI